MFIGTTRLFKSEDSAHPLATDVLTVDVIAPSTFDKVLFEDIMLFIDVLEPATVEWVEHANTHFRWGTLENGQWVEPIDNSPLTPTRQLRARYPKDSLYSGVGNGLSFWIGVHGLENGQALSFHLNATASRVVAVTDGCGITMSDFHVNDQLTGMRG